MVDFDDTIVEVHGYQKGAAIGYSGVRWLNALLATVSTEDVAPVIASNFELVTGEGSPIGAECPPCCGPFNDNRSGSWCSFPRRALVAGRLCAWWSQMRCGLVIVLPRRSVGRLVP